MGETFEVTILRVALSELLGAARRGGVPASDVIRAFGDGMHEADRAHAAERDAGRVPVSQEELLDSRKQRAVDDHVDASAIQFQGFPQSPGPVPVGTSVRLDHGQRPGESPQEFLRGSDVREVGGLRQGIVDPDAWLHRLDRSRAAHRKILDLHTGRLSRQDMTLGKQGRRVGEVESEIAKHARELESLSAVYGMSVNGKLVLQANENTSRLETHGEMIQKTSNFLDKLRRVCGRRFVEIDGLQSRMTFIDDDHSGWIAAVDADRADLQERLTAAERTLKLVDQEQKADQARSVRNAERITTLEGLAENAAGADMVRTLSRVQDSLETRVFETDKQCDAIKADVDMRVRSLHEELDVLAKRLEKKLDRTDCVEDTDPDLDSSCGE